MEQKVFPTKRYITVGVVLGLIVLYILLHVGYLMNLNDTDMLTAFLGIGDHIASAPFQFGYNPETLWLGLIVYSGVFALQYLNSKKRYQMRPGRDHGTAKWYTDMKDFNKKFSYPKDKPFAEETPSYKNRNLILGNDLFFSMDGRQTMRNINTLVVGGSGSGKSRFFVKPNLLQANCSYVVTDPSGELLEATGKFFKGQGYRVRVFNLVDMAMSNKYNPFNYIRDDQGVAQMVNCLIKNTTPDGAGKGDPFWEKSEVALLQAISYYLYHECPMEDRNFSNVMRMVRLAKVSEEDENLESVLDVMFNKLAEKKGEDHIAVKNYKTFKMGAGKTLKSILISVSVRLNAFNLPAVENLTQTDDVDLGTMGDQKSILYVILPSADATFNFLAALMYSQLFESLYFHAENDVYCVENSNKENVAFFKSRDEAEDFISSIKSTIIRKLPSKDGENEQSILVATTTGKVFKSGPTKAVKEYKEQCKGELQITQTGKRLKNHVRFLLDEFANIGQIPDFDKKLATMRKYEISCAIILQNLAQLEAQYDKASKTIQGNCDLTVFLGSPEMETLKMFSELLGKETIYSESTNKSKGKGGASTGTNSIEHPLATPEQLRTMPRSKAVVIISQLDPFYIDKYDYPRHPNYKFTGDADKKNAVTAGEILEYSDEPTTKEVSSEERAKIEEVHNANASEREQRRIEHNAKRNKNTVFTSRNEQGDVFMAQQPMNQDTLHVKEAVPEEIEERFTMESAFCPDYEYQLPEGFDVKTFFDENKTVEDASSEALSDEKALDEAFGDIEEPIIDTEDYEDYSDEEIDFDLEDE